MSPLRGRRKRVPRRGLSHTALIATFGLILGNVMEKGAGDANVSVGRGYGFQRWAQGGLLALFGGQKNGAVGAPKPGILRDGKKSRAAQRVTWPTVFVREDKDAQAALLDGTESDPAATPLSGMRAYGEILRLPTLAYELILIPLRVAYPELFIGRPGRDLL